MIDDNWDLINGEAAHAIEVLNYSNQVNVIEALVRLLTHNHGIDEKGCLVGPNVNVLREFHRTATLFLLHHPGEFRTDQVHVATQDGRVVHMPPSHDEVATHMTRFFQLIEAQWREADAVNIGAYALWVVNWVHPFKNGNGRSARAFCYACICLKIGFFLPGSPTVIDLIMQNRDEYQSALKVADEAYAATGEPELGPMIAFVGGLLVQQLSTVPVTPSE
ncbi:Fic family protein [Sphingobium cupriresistens]|uniref:Cell filamentation protein Fic n=1 Tax=Sphingobium cupriresistens LL01 TaxID=1420583 RepID=A0A0J7XQX3_9SPHN|nr:Fic family protein [Sphingobium cupriresistens]KMS54067.1 cell filamentation protein Fic [Sphingobium cupriresistens LL01]